MQKKLYLISNIQTFNQTQSLYFYGLKMKNKKTEIQRNIYRWYIIAVMIIKNNNHTLDIECVYIRNKNKISIFTFNISEHPTKTIIKLNSNFYK